MLGGGLKCEICRIKCEFKKNIGSAVMSAARAVRDENFASPFNPLKQFKHLYDFDDFRECEQLKTPLHKSLICAPS